MGWCRKRGRSSDEERRLSNMLSTFLKQWVAIPTGPSHRRANPVGGLTGVPTMAARPVLILVPLSVRLTRDHRSYSVISKLRPERTRISLA